MSQELFLHEALTGYCSYVAPVKELPNLPATNEELLRLAIGATIEEKTLTASRCFRASPQTVPARTGVEMLLSILDNPRLHQKE
jgi:hypothetical protein